MRQWTLVQVSNHGMSEIFGCLTAWCKTSPLTELDSPDKCIVQPLLVQEREPFTAYSSGVTQPIRSLWPEHKCDIQRWRPCISRHFGPKDSSLRLVRAPGLHHHCSRYMFFEMYLGGAQWWSEMSPTYHVCGSRHHYCSEPMRCNKTGSETVLYKGLDCQNYWLSSILL